MSTDQQERDLARRDLDDEMEAQTKATTSLYEELSKWRHWRMVHGYWATWDAHPLADWQAEVANDDTRESYDEWVINAIERKYYEANAEDVP